MCKLWNFIWILITCRSIDKLENQGSSSYNTRTSWQEISVEIRFKKELVKIIQKSNKCYVCWTRWFRRVSSEFCWEIFSEVIRKRFDIHLFIFSGLDNELPQFEKKTSKRVEITPQLVIKCHQINGIFQSFK